MFFLAYVPSCFAHAFASYSLNDSFVANRILKEEFDREAVEFTSENEHRIQARIEKARRSVRAELSGRANSEIQKIRQSIAQSQIETTLRVEALASLCSGPSEAEGAAASCIPTEASVEVEGGAP